MDSQRWVQIEELFHHAYECDPAQRDRMLEESGDSDPELQRTVEALLASAKAAAENLQAAIYWGLDAVAFPLVGEEISHYRILAGIGTGGMGSVYRAEDVKLRRQVALKVLAQEFAQDSAALSRFEREARSASALEHPGICPIYEFGEHAGQPFLVMPLLQGQTLRELLARRAPAPLEISELLNLAVQIAEALDAAHRHGIIHRDIKPANIFVTTQGEVKILDFGVAKSANAEIAEDESPGAARAVVKEDSGSSTRVFSTPEALLSRTGVALGTSAYMSPEQARGEKLDARTDIFSFGLMLYEMATGQRAFQEATERILHDVIFQQNPTPVRQINPALPAKLEAIIERAQERNRDARYPTAAELRADLAAVRAATSGRSVGSRRRLLAAALGCAVLVAVALAWYFMATPRTAPITPAIATFAPPPHSIAVLPFVNISGDQEQEYFSDGLTEELLNSLSRIHELQVAARTSSFYFKGKDVDLPTIAHKLNVASVLEGSVRRSGNKIRITAQFNDAVTGFHLWSQTYDRDLSDVLKLQTEIATAVASALKVTVLGDEAARIELGGTRNPAAFDAYLRATKGYLAYKNREEVQAAIAGYSEAIRLDPNYALAYAARSGVLLTVASHYVKRAVIAAANREALVDARKALALAPDLGLGHAALARAFADALDFAPAGQEYDRAIALDPSNSWILGHYGLFAVSMGHTDAGLKALRRAVALDPLNAFTHGSLGLGLILARRYDEALQVLGTGRALTPENPYILRNMGFAHYALGNYQAARGFCEQTDQRDPVNIFCLALTYDKLGRRSDAEVTLSKFRALIGDAANAGYVWVYAQSGQTDRALDELEGAMRLRDPYLIQLKVNFLTDPLRNEPRFQAIERALKFPPN